MGHPLPVTIQQKGDTVNISLAKDAVLKFKVPGFLGDPSQILNLFSVAYDPTTGEVSITAKADQSFQVKAPPLFEFGESLDGEKLEVGYKVPIPPIGFIHIPVMAYWNPSTGSIGAKGFKDVENYQQ